jgi:N-acetylglucosamine-6-phosphate deacetylase
MAVDVRDGVARIAGTDTIAGSTTTMDQLFRRAVHAWAPEGRAADEALVHAVRQTATIPARVLRRTDIGSLEAGRRADVVVLDAALQVAGVVVGGAAVSA